MNDLALAAIAAVAAVAAAAWYVSLRLWPNTGCRSCGGTGRNAGSNRRRWGACRRCGGSGRRLPSISVMLA